MALPNFGGWFAWGLTIFVSLPLLVIVLGELSRALGASRHAAYRKPLDLFRGSALFLLFLTILLRKVAELPDTHLAVMIVDTAFWIAVLNAALALVNAILFDTGSVSRAAQTPKLLVDLGRLFLVAIGGAIIVSYVWKVDLTGLLAALGVGSVVIGLALQDTLGNVFSGLTMLSSGPFRIGDWVKIGDIEGRVQSISMRSLTLALLNGDRIDIPNSAIAKEKLSVIGAANGWCNVSVEIKIDQEYSPGKVREVLLQAARAVPVVLETPGPSVHIKEFSGADIIYKVILFVADFTHRPRASSEFLTYLWYVAAREGLRLRPPDAAAPTVSVNLTDAPGGAVPARAVQSTVTQAIVSPSLADDIEAVGTFQIRRDMIDILAHGARRELYRQGEMLMVRGHRAQAVLIVKSGSARLVVDDGQETPTWTFEKGDLILFKSFFRGGEIPSSVQCMTDVEIIRIPIESLATCLAQDATLAQMLERMLAARDAASGSANALQGDNANDNDRVRILETLFKV